MSKEKKETQTTLDMGEYIEALEKKLETGFTGLITEVVPVTNAVFFKDNSKTFDEKEGISVKVKLMGSDDPVEFTQWFSKPNFRGYEQSNIYAFKKKYGCVPIKGKEVQCHIDENGFFRIQL